MPKLLARKIVAIETGRAEGGDDPLAIGYGSGGAVGILALGRFTGGIFHAGLPEEPAICAIETNERAAMRGADGLGHEDAIAPDNGRRIAALGKIGPPAHIFGGAPLEREIFTGSDAGAIRAAPRRPIAGGRGKCE